ncbi:SigB/SigF/SigG family RNA polymerase sigma factor [Nocardia blacklockiae]|uniref:SigB/SigF/SigG family RNA polymerase sigma factor n=1 Tax=Nocardia blacklockiae TaxID=480036 RepID=UPI001895F769|nr:SigB/SigF/SigG family RNA polymerase sigma factor [Nocardia blacklockiae]MBF6171910.1 SigB/SigF/SigG family RNA polymerase sigma factor [Nocardia blacklockiae]
MTTDAPSVQSSTARRSRRGNDSYDGIEPLFADLARLDPGGLEYRRLREDIIVRCLPLAEHIARKFSGRGLDYDDLLQVARMGLIAAVNRFDPERGATFLGFAVPTVMGEVRRHFRDQGWALRVPRALKELRQRIAAITPELAQRLDRMPTAGDLAEALEVDREDITQALVAADCYRTESLDTPVEAGEGHTPLADLLGDTKPCYGLLENAITVRPLIAALPERDRQILVERFFAGRSQAEIGKQFGVSQMQIHRTLKRILNTLREQALAEPSRAA